MRRVHSCLKAGIFIQKQRGEARFVIPKGESGCPIVTCEDTR